MIRPEALAALSRWREALMAACVVGAGIWLCGGGTLATALAGEIDRLVVKSNPVTLGGGIPLFAPGGYAPASWRVESVTPFASGVVLGEYARV